ncbi:MAG TPA: hypothetical protein VGW33_05815 [Terriglobia bacterium]|nr:hypothetical protein [Terriglobia bacterium]
MAEPNHAARLIRQFREKFGRELRAQAERLETAEGNVRELRDRQQELEASFEQQIDLLEKLAESEPPSGASPAAAPPAAPPATAIEAVQAEADSGQKVLNDAQRFARLLVSEIELYHRDEVAEGRRRHDLYARLRSAIERSRQAYEKRFGRSAANACRYFDDELVKTLASGDPALLGPEYPGSTP